MTKKYFLLAAIFAIGTNLVVLTPSANAQARITNPVKLTATASSGAATLNGVSGIITSESITTAAAADYTLTITNSAVKNGANIVPLVWVMNGTNSGGAPTVSTVTGGTTQIVVKIHNSGASAFNGTIKVGFQLLAP